MTDRYEARSDAPSMFTNPVMTGATDMSMTENESVMRRVDDLSDSNESDGDVKRIDTSQGTVNVLG